MTAVIFFIFAALALAGALGVVLARNPVHSALLLVVTLVSVAVFFLQEQAELLAVVQIVVYAGAIVVLFLFVIMLLGVDREESLRDPIPYQRPAAIALGVILLGEVLFLAGHQWATGKTADSLHTIKGGATDLGGNVERVARVLFTDFLWPFEITTALLVIAVVGGVVLARRSGQPADLPTTDESEAGGPSAREPGIPARSEGADSEGPSAREPGIPARSEGADSEGASARSPGIPASSERADREGRSS